VNQLIISRIDALAARAAALFPSKLLLINVVAQPGPRTGRGLG